MISFEEALRLAREAHPLDLIRTGFNYKNKYYFLWSPGKELIPGDTAIGLFIVDGKKKRCANRGYVEYFTELYSSGRTVELDNIVAMMDNPTYIDVTKQQLSDSLKSFLE